MDLSEDNRQKVLKGIAKRGKNAEVKALKKQMTDSFAYLLLYVEAKVSNGGLDFATVRKNVADPQEVYRALWTSNRKRFLQMVGQHAKRGRKTFSN